MQNINQLQYLKTYFSKSITNNARYSIRLFLFTIYGQGKIEDLAERYFKENRDIETYIQSFFAKIKHRPPISIRTILSRVKTFLIENEREIPQRFWKRLKQKKGNFSKDTRQTSHKKGNETNPS